MFYYLLFTTTLFTSVLSRGRRIDIFSQTGGGDIGQLRSVPKSNVMYNALPRDSEMKWDRMKSADGSYIMPYVVTGLYDSSEKSIIAEAMRRIENNTCLLFRKRSNERDYIELQNEAGEGCYTNVGRFSGRNVVMLEANDRATCIEPDIVIHELMHTIGLWHEHMRYDRDNYITVLHQNIQPVYESQFEKITPSQSTTYNVPYDYRSVMHYAETAFAKRGKISMQTKDPSFQKVIGNQRDASPNDYRKICIMYGCSMCMGKQFDGNNFVEKQEPKKIVESILPPITAAPAVNLPDIVAVGDNLVQQQCYDMIPFICSTMVNSGVVDCSYFGSSSCCASCATRLNNNNNNNNIVNNNNNNNNDNNGGSFWKFGFFF